jgi:hypothetical protein
VSWRHFRAILWLRYRLLWNQARRVSIVSGVLLIVWCVGCFFMSVGSFTGSLLLGLAVRPESPTDAVLFGCDGLVVFFLFVWNTSLMTEIQQVEALTPQKFLHFPVSLAGVFLVNYLSALVNLRMLVFVPALLGLILGLTISRGPQVLLCVPLLVAFFLTVAALSYQFQGWLTAKMSNPRGHRNVIVTLLIVVCVFAETPVLAMSYGFHRYLNEVVAPRLEEREAIRLEKAANLQREEELEAEKERISAKEYARRAEENTRAAEATTEKLKQYRERHEQLKEDEKTLEALRHAWQQLVEWARVANRVLPPLWLPLGVAAAVEGNVVPALLGTLGLGLVGTASLWRSYRTTLRLYTGRLNPGRKPRPTPAAPGRPRSLLLERKLPWLSEPAAATALAGFRSLARAPEAKILLLGPLLIMTLFGSMFAAASGPIAKAMNSGLPRAFLALVAVGFVILTTAGIVGNQFGFDRGGFRVFVLSGAPRREILLGKNLASVPFVGALGGASMLGMQLMLPMPVDLFLALIFQAVSMYFLLCMLANWPSILAPIPHRAGGTRPPEIKPIPILFQVVCMLLFPLAALPTLLPLGIEFALKASGLVRGVPVCLLLAAGECAIVVVVYRLVLGWQARVLHAREQRILETLTGKAE